MANVLKMATVADIVTLIQAASPGKNILNYANAAEINVIGPLAL